MILFHISYFVFNSLFTLNFYLYLQKNKIFNLTTFDNDLYTKMSM